MASKTKAPAPAESVEREECLTCDNKAQTRGLCFTCRAAASAVVARGEKTEQELIDSGLMLPAKRKGRPAKSGFAKAMSSIRKPTKAKGSK